MHLEFWSHWNAGTFIWANYFQSCPGFFFLKCPLHYNFPNGLPLPIRTLQRFRPGARQETPRPANGTPDTTDEDRGRGWYWHLGRQAPTTVGAGGHSWATALASRVPVPARAAAGALTFGPANRARARPLLE